MGWGEPRDTSLSCSHGTDQEWESVEAGAEMSECVGDEGSVEGGGGDS